MENFEKVLKRELKPLKDNIHDIKNEMSSLKVDISDKMNNFKIEMRDEMNDFRTEIKEVVGNEIRERFFVFEEEYSKPIKIIHDNVLQLLQTTARNSAEIGIQKKKIEELQTKYLSHDDQIKEIEKKIDSKNVLKKVGNLSPKV